MSSPIREQVYKDPRPKEHFDRFHARTRRGEPDWVYEAVRIVTSLYAWTFFRARGHDAGQGARRAARSSSRRTTSRSWTTSSSARSSAGACSFMAKSQLFKPPMQWIFTHGGVFPVRRGYAGRGGVHHRERDPRARRRDRHVLRGRPVAHGGAVASSPSAASAGSRSSRARRSSRSPSTAPRTCATGSAGSSRRWTSPTATSSSGTGIAEPTRDQQQAVANEIFSRVKTLYAGLRD